MGKEQNRIEKILNVLLEYTQKDFSNKIELSGKNDEIDAVALGINVIGEELGYYIDELENKNIKLIKHQNELRDANQFLNSILNNIPNMIFLKDAEELRFIRFNKAGEELLGIPSEEMIGKNDYDFFPKEEADLFIKDDREVLEKGEMKDIPEEKIQTKDKGERWLHTKKIPLVFGDKNKKKYLLGISEDITEQRKNREKLKAFNEELQAKNEELQSQQEELRQTNEELEEHAEKLKEQQEELEGANEELEEQRQTIEENNASLEEANRELEIKAEKLRQASRYKSEFLANMSHELRSPLNSLLILSKDMAEGASGNLGEEELKSASIIHESGQELLELINDILDLSKIEAGKMEVMKGNVRIKDMASEIKTSFINIASEKGVELKTIIDKGAPETIYSDKQRIKQILKNFVSNAVKFTEEGQVTIRFSPANRKNLKISVSDTGIGIPPEKQELIFDSFTQAEGGTSRKYGGTGLGLAIAHQLIQLLGGKLEMESSPGKGSTFSVILPFEGKIEKSYELKWGGKGSQSQKREKLADDHKAIEDDREDIHRKDNTILVIEDDEHFAGILKKEANDMNLKCLIATNGEDGLILAGKYNPDAIILDMKLPGIGGEEVLKALKENEQLRDIPVHVISALAEEKHKELDTVQHLTKPVSKKELTKAFERIESLIERKVKKLLIVEDHEKTRKALKKILSGDGVEVMESGTVKEALKNLKGEIPDCIVLDMQLPDGTGTDVMKFFEREKETPPPVIVYTGKEINEEEVDKMKRWASSIVMKKGKSEERLLDEATLFLHQTSQQKQKKQPDADIKSEREEDLDGKRILLVDDDMRHSFGISKVLSRKGVEVIKAANGKKALEIMKSDKDIDLILMDIMMPEMDGYETTEKIRKMEEFEDLPIIALTAKAMKDDRKKCIEAGASDYMSKPVDTNKLLSLIRVWVH